MSMVGNSGLIIKVIINLSILIGHINMLKFCNPFRYALYLNIESGDKNETHFQFKIDATVIVALVPN